VHVAPFREIVPGGVQRLRDDWLVDDLIVRRFSDVAIGGESE